MWQHLVGSIKHYAPAGGAGTVTVGAGESVLIVQAHASGAGATVTILGGTAIPLAPGVPFAMQAFHTLLQSNQASTTVVFSGTDFAYVQTVKQGNL